LDSGVQALLKDRGESFECLGCGRYTYLDRLYILQDWEGIDWLFCGGCLKNYLEDEPLGYHYPDININIPPLPYL
jgi:hypothetical protein